MMKNKSLIRSSGEMLESIGTAQNSGVKKGRKDKNRFPASRN